MDRSCLPPLHVDNLSTLPRLEAAGWKGPDASLEISLMEYGMAWKVLDEPDADGDDVYFIYSLGRKKCEDGVVRLMFDRAGMSSSTDVRKQWDWAFNDGDRRTERTTPAQLTGLTEEEWDGLDFHCKVYDLFQLHGYENLFGTAYWEGFEIRQRNPHNIMFDMASSIVTHLEFEDIPVRDLVAAARRRLDDIEKENNPEAFGFCDEYECEDGL